MKDIYYAISTLFGGVVGAGIFGIPYIFYKFGFFTGIISLLLILFGILITNLYIGEIVLRTKTKHQLVGYTELYLGKSGKFIMMISLLIGLYGAMIAYLIGISESLNTLYPLNPVIYSIFILMIFSIFIFKGLNIIKNSELILNFLKFIIIALIFIVIIFSGKINLSNISGFEIKSILNPFGVILFAFLGGAAIPEMREILKNPKDLKKSIILGTGLIAILYLLFAFFIISVTGSSTTELATIGLGQIFGKPMLILLDLFVIFAMGGAFLVWGLALKEIFNYDYKINKTLSAILVLIVPLLSILLGVKSFIQMIEITGALSGGITGVMLVILAKRAEKLGNRKPEYTFNKNIIVLILITLIFIAGGLSILL